MTGSAQPLDLAEVDLTDCAEYVCLSVCPLAHLENHTAELHQIFRA